MPTKWLRGSQGCGRASQRWKPVCLVQVQPHCWNHGWLWLGQVGLSVWLWDPCPGTPRCAVNHLHKWFSFKQSISCWGWGHRIWLWGRSECWACVVLGWDSGPGFQVGAVSVLQYQNKLTSNSCCCQASCSERSSHEQTAPNPTQQNSVCTNADRKLEINHKNQTLIVNLFSAFKSCCLVPGLSHAGWRIKSRCCKEPHGDPGQPAPLWSVPLASLAVSTGKVAWSSWRAPASLSHNEKIALPPRSASWCKS